MSMRANVADILNEFQPKGVLTEALGDVRSKITGISAIETCGPGDLVFVDKSEFVDFVRTRRPTAVVTSAALKARVVESGAAAILVAPNVPLAHALLKQKYSGRDFDAAGWPRIHNSAVIHETALIAKSATIEPKVVIGKNTRVGERVRILAGAVIEHDVEIGDDTIIHPNSVIGYGSRIGKECVIGSGTVLGSEGYGFAQDEKRHSHLIPQTGIVVLEDRVRLGANCCIDRATYRETRIGAGTKLDNLCHVAHNVQIGKDCLLTAFLCVAGSTEIGDRVIASGQTGVLDHMKICSDVVLLHRAGVAKEIEKPGAYAGLPLLPLSEYMKNSAVMKGAAELRKRVAAIEKRLGTEGVEN